MLKYTSILLLLLPVFLKAQIIDYYPKVDTLCIEGHCMLPEIILSQKDGTLNDTLSIKCWSTVWWPKGIEDFEYLQGESIFYVISDPNNNNRYEFWIADTDSLNQANMLVPFDDHFSLPYLMEYFRLKVYVYSEEILTDSLIQYFQVSTQMGVNEKPNRSKILEGQILKNYPNPFNSQTTISYRLPYDTVVSLKIYNSIGQEIDELISIYQTAGNYEINWDTTNLSTSTYYIKLQTQKAEFIKKCTVIK